MASDLVSDALGGVSNAMRSGRGFTRNPRNTQNHAGHIANVETSYYGVSLACGKSLDL